MDFLYFTYGQIKINLTLKYGIFVLVNGVNLAIAIETMALVIKTGRASNSTTLCVVKWNISNNDLVSYCYCH